MPGYRWIVGDLRTGKIARTVEFLNSRWSTDIEDDGSLEASFPLRSGKWKTSRSDAAPAKSFVVIAYIDDRDDEYMLAGGPIWTSRFNEDSGELAIGAAGMSSIFDHRKLIPVLAADEDPAKASVKYDTQQLGLIAKRLIELAMAHAGGELPIVLPSDAALGGEGSAHTRTYPGYELATVGERLTQLSDVIGGPEIQFQPRRRSDDPRFIEWVARIATDATGGLLSQSGPDWTFDRSVPRSPVKGIDINTDGSGMSFRSWAAGQGEAEGRPIVFETSNDLVDLGWPLLDSEVTSTDTVTSKATLRGHARADLAANARPIETWTVKVDRDATPHAGRYRPGDWCSVKVNDHAYIPDGSYRMRITAVSGTDDTTVSLSMAPRLGEV